MTTGEIVAVTGAAGGAGTTRLTLEFAGTLARTDREVAVVDAAYATQGLASVVPEQVEPDVTELTIEDRPLSGSLVDLAVPASGRVAVAPARAPFARLSRAKASDAAQRLAARLGTAAEEYDAVLVDVPPVAANQSVAAVTAADRVALVAPDSLRGRDAVARHDERLADVDATVDAVVANRVTDGTDLAAADAAVPVAPEQSLPAAPTCVDPDDTFAPAVARAVEIVLDVDLDLEFPESDGLSEYLPG
jgi:septum site-determining protein MinD